MIGILIPATVAHAHAMAPRMRQAEVLEVRDAAGLSPEDMLLAELGRSSIAWSWIVDGQVGCMFGVVTKHLLDVESYPWFLTTPLVEKYARQFARSCRELLPELLSHHPRLIGMVDARYKLSIRWLTWLGAKLSPPEPWGVANQPFCRFVIGD